MRYKTLEKLRNLYRHAKSAVGYGNHCEARDYYRKIISICRKHKISRQEFYQSFSARARRRRRQKGSPLADGEAVFTRESKMFRRRRVFWEENLFKAIAKFFGCRAYINNFNNIKIAVGPAPQRRLCIDSYLHLYETALAEAKTYVVTVKQQTAEDAPLDRTKQILLKRSFYYGFAQGVTSRLNSLSAALQSIVQYESAFGEQTTSMVVYNGPSEAPTEKRLPLAAHLKIKREMLDAHAYYAGISAGSFIALDDSLQLVEQTTFAKFREIENAKAEQRRREREIEDMRIIKRNARRRGSRVRGAASAHSYRYEIITPNRVETFAGVQQAFRFD